MIDKINNSKFYFKQSYSQNKEQFYTEHNKNIKKNTTLIETINFKITLHSVNTIGLQIIQQKIAVF